MSLGRKRIYCIERLAVLRSLQKDKRSRNVELGIRQEIAELEIELLEVESKVKGEPHSRWKPQGLRKGNPWVCNCGAINVYENEHCWASKPILEEEPSKPKAKELSEQQKEFVSNFKPQSERAYSDGLGDIEEFFAFLDE